MFRDSKGGSAHIALAENLGWVPSTHMVVSPVPEDLMVSSELPGYQACTRCTSSHSGKKINK